MRDVKVGRWKLYRSGLPTRVNLELRECCKEPYGRPHPYDYKHSWSGGPYNPDPSSARTALNKLALVGLVEDGATGPRGGLRWRATPLGRTVLAIIDTYKPNSPEMQTALRLIGL